MENWKERFEYIYVVEENKGEKYLRKYDHTTIVEELEYFISLELGKAERRGLEKALGFIIGEGNINWAKDRIVESIKLLEEENGKQDNK